MNYHAVVTHTHDFCTVYIPEIDKSIEIDEKLKVDEAAWSLIGEKSEDDSLEVVEHHDSTTLYSDPFVTLDLVEVEKKDKTTYLHRRISNTSNFGSVIIPTTLIRGVRHVGLVVQDRPAVSLTDTYEFPRGSTVDHSPSEANRELQEETGIVLDDDRLEKVGSFFADTGIVSTEVAVFVAHVPEKMAKTSLEHVEDESGARTEWFMYGDFLAKVFSNEIVDGHTLAAFTLAQLKGKFVDIF